MVLALLAVVSATLFQLQTRSHEHDVKELNVFVPFVFSREIDPRAVYTVGDQLISEHIFAYHYSASEKNSIIPLFSHVKIDREKNKVELHLRKKISDGEGKIITVSEICEAVKSSFSGTQHTSYSSLVQDISCIDDLITITMETIPVNLEYWLRSTDFAIYDITKLPVSASALHATTGPYNVSSLESKKVVLKRNENFPEELIANKVPEVIIRSYSSGNPQSLLLKDNLHLAYVYGYTLNESFVQELRKKNFELQVFPNEWLVYLSFQKRVNPDERIFIAKIIDDMRADFQKEIMFGNPAYSTTPMDRAYGLSKEEYEEHRPSTVLTKLDTKYVVATLDEWANIPLFKLVLENLSKQLNFEVKLYPREEMAKIYSPEGGDLFLSPVGISAADPLGNYSYMHTYFDLIKATIPENALIDLYKEKDFRNFSNRIKEIEKNLLKERAIIPLGHFPGVVVESPFVKRDETISWDWGIQAWTYKIN